MSAPSQRKLSKVSSIDIDMYRRSREDKSNQIRKEKRSDRMDLQRKMPTTPGPAAAVTVSINNNNANDRSSGTINSGGSEKSLDMLKDVLNIVPQMYADLLLNYANNTDNASQSVFNGPRNKTVLAAALFFRKILAVDVNAPIFIIFELPLFVPALLSYLFHPCSSALQLEVAWILTNIACGSPEEVRFLLSCTIDLPVLSASTTAAAGIAKPPRRGNIINIVYYLLHKQAVSPTGSANSIEVLREHLLWMLGNLTADSLASRILVLNNTNSTMNNGNVQRDSTESVSEPADAFPSGGVVAVLLQFAGIRACELHVDAKLQASLSTMRALVWIFNNLSRDLMTDPDCGAATKASSSAGGNSATAVGTSTANGASASVVPVSTSLMNLDQVLGVCNLLSLLVGSPDEDLLLDCFDCFSHVLDNYSWQRERSRVIVEYVLSTGVLSPSCSHAASVYKNTLYPNIQTYLHQLYELPPGVSPLHYSVLLFHTVNQGELMQCIRASGIRTKQLIGPSNSNTSMMRVRGGSYLEIFNTLFISIYNCCLSMEARCLFIVTLINRVCVNCNQCSDGYNVGASSSSSSSNDCSGTTSNGIIKHSQLQLRRLLSSDLGVVSLILWYLPLVSVKLKTDMVWCLCSLIKLAPATILKMIFPSHGELASGFGSGSNSSTDILTVMSALITRFQLPPRKQSDMAGVDSTIICTQYDFILACSCLLCCIGEYAVKWGQTNNSNSLILNISRQLFFLSYTCMLILEKHQQTDLICTLCVQLHAVLMQCANSGVGVGQEALMQPRQAWVEFLEPLQYSQRSNLVQASGLLLDWLGSANTDDGDENS